MGICGAQVLLGKWWDFGGAGFCTGLDKKFEDMKVIVEPLGNQ